MTESGRACYRPAMGWVDSVPSFSKDAGSTNYFMVLCVRVPIEQDTTPKQSLVHDIVVNHLSEA
jgi:hypothetical protein